MSRRNGDRARFQKERKRKMLRRQRVQEFITAEAGTGAGCHDVDAGRAQGWSAQGRCGGQGRFRESLT